MYVNKEVFKVPSNLNVLGTDLLATSPFQTMRELPQLSYLISNFETYDWVNLFINMPINFLSSVHSINRIFNSDKYENLEEKGLNELTPIMNIEEDLMKAYNNTLDIDYLKLILSQNNVINAPINNGGDPYGEMQSWQDSAVNSIYSRLSFVNNLYEQVKEELRLAKLQKAGASVIAKLNSQLSSLRWEKFDLNNIIEKVQNLLGLTGSKAKGKGQTPLNPPLKGGRAKGFNEQELEAVRNLILNPNRIHPREIINPQEYLLRPRQLTAPPGSPLGVLGMMTEMSNFFLNFFGISASTNILPALNYLVTSLALKAVGGGGITAVHYLCGHILRQNVALLPVIVQQTGMWGMAWGMLAPFAPWIILAGTAIAVGLRKQAKLGEKLYLFGGVNNPIYPDMSYLILSESNNQEIYETLTNQAETMRNNGNKSYDGDSDFLYGYSVYKDDIQYGLNLKNSEDIKMMNRVELETSFPVYYNKF